MKRSDLAELFFTDFNGERVKCIHVDTDDDGNLKLIFSNSQMKSDGIALQHTITSTEIEWDYTK